MDKFTLVDYTVLGLGVLVLVCLFAIAFMLEKIAGLTRRAEIENNKLKQENQELRDRIEELTPKPQTQSLVQTGLGLSDHGGRRKEQISASEYAEMVGSFPANMSPPPAPQVIISQHRHQPIPASRSKPAPLPSSSRVRDVHHHHHHHSDDNTLLHTAIAVSVLSSSDDTPARSTPSCAPSRDDSYSAPSYDSSDSSSPSCD